MLTICHDALESGSNQGLHSGKRGPFRRCKWARNSWHRLRCRLIWLAIAELVSSRIKIMLNYDNSFSLAQRKFFDALKSGSDDVVLLLVSSIRHFLSRRRRTIGKNCYANRAELMKYSLRQPPSSSSSPWLLFIIIKIWWLPAMIWADKQCRRGYRTVGTRNSILCWWTN